MAIQKHKNLKGGQAIITAVVLFLFISITATLGVAGPVFREVQIARDISSSKESYFLSESGQEDAIYRLKNGLQISSSEILTLNGFTVTTDINDSLGGKTISSTANTNSLIRNLEVEIVNTTGITFNYGAQAGEGGIEMDTNSRIEGSGETAGNVYSNGPIDGSSGAVITGDAIVSGGVLEDQQASSTICNSDQIVGQSDPEIDFAQSFIPSVSQTIGKVSLYIKKVGDTKDREIRIVLDDDGKPDDDDLARGKLKKNLVGTDYAWIDVPFSSPPSVTLGQTYWIVLDAKKDPNKYWIWCKDQDNGYTNGSIKYSQDWDDNNWTAVNGDLTFRIFVGGEVNKIEDVQIDGTAKANTIEDSVIGGDAYYQSITGSTVGGISYPGSPDQPIISFPISDANIISWKNDAGCGVQPATGDCLYSGDYDVTSDVSLGPLTITGNLIMKTNNKTLTITGIIYVKGNIDISNGVEIICDSSYGSESCILMTDGWIHIKNNGSFLGSGSAVSYVMFLTTLACTGSDDDGLDCTHHDGAVDLHNNASGAIFYATKGMVNLHNGVNVSEITAYKIRLDNNSVITYDSGLINTQFSAGPSGGWVINTWKEVE